MAEALTTEQLPDARPRASDEHRAYSPSWLDRLTSLVEHLPVPAWVFYLVLWGALSLLLAGVKWLDGTYPPGHFEDYHLLYTGIPCYVLAAIHYLDDLAGRALNRFRPALVEDKDGAASIQYRLTTMPALPVLIITLAAVAVVLLPVNQWDPSQMRVLQFGTSPSADVVETLISIADCTLISLFVYHTIHQLRVVNHVYASHTHIDLLKLGPVYAFSTLTAVTAAVPIPPLYLETVLLPESAYVGRTGQLVLLWVIFGLIGLATFLLPLLGAHRLLEREKERVQSETVGRIEVVLAQMHSRVESGDYGDVESTTSMKNLLDSLIVERNLLQQVSTWPWNPETPRILATALILPILLLLISQIITRLFGP